MNNLKAHDYPEIYQWLGINLNTLGCVMADLHAIDIAQPNWLKLYTSANLERSWIRGWVADQNPHVTLLYGLLQKATNYKKHIDTVLEGWGLNHIEIEYFDYFPSPYEDEDYYCIVGHVKKTLELLEGHQRLSFLPHINTFPEYTPHVTIAYIEKDEKMMVDFCNYLEKYKGKRWEVKEIKLGK